MNCVHCGAECSNNHFDAYPLYPKDNVVCGKCVFKVLFTKNDCNMVGINYKTKSWSYYPLKPV